MKFLAILMMGLVLLGCRKSQRDQDESVLASTDQATIDMVVSSILSMVDEAARKEYGVISSYSSQYLLCTVVSDNLGTSPQTIVIDFGPQCNGSNNRVYKGKIHMSMTGDYLDSNTITTLSFIDFFIDDMEIMGSISLTNNGTNASGNLNYRLKYTDLAIDSNGDSPWNATYSANLNRELIAGGATPEVSDDIYSISGSGSGRSRSGNAFVYSISSPVQIDASCKWFVTSGELELTPDNLTTRYIDYGSGSCTSTAIVTFNEILHEVTFP